jgi:alkanesulfonate monooxygenase SsuD/methylene tetrahydromethanopterin reductase-like flavin-dependent oxidoreductase (luciferase family)
LANGEHAAAVGQQLGSVTTDVHPWVAEARSRVRFSIVAAFVPDFDELTAFVVGAEERGFDAYWVNDHPTRSMDTFTSLAALAAETTTIRLISLVSCVYYHAPYLIARGAADVDRMSKGRLVLGLGVGDDVPEFSMLGLPFPPAAERHRALTDAIVTIQGLLAGEPQTSPGPFPLTDATLKPGPVQQPRIPLLIGGGGERFTLRQVARYADVSNFGPHEWVGNAFEPDDVRRKYEVLRRYCDEVGRPYEAVLRSHWTPLLTLAPDRDQLERKREAARIPDAKLNTKPLFATPDEAVAHYSRLVDAGAEYFLATVNGQDQETIDLLAERVVPALQDR